MKRISGRLKGPMFFHIALLMVLISMTADSAEGPSGKPRKIPKAAIVDSKLLDVNQIEAWISNQGVLFSNPTTGGNGLFYPANQQDLSLVYSAGLWVLGKIGDDIRSAAAFYATEFQPGTILDNRQPDDPAHEKYRIYKYNQGNVVDQVAINQGCPTEVLGDQMLFAVYNDYASHADVWTIPPIGLEVQQTVFAFDRTGPLGNTVFIKFRIINKGQASLQDTYAAMWFDPDLGYSLDDAIGCDTTLGIGYAYNFDADDDGKYGTTVPALGCDFLQGPIVPSAGDTARFSDGTLLPDNRMLGMTAYFPIINSSRIPGTTDPLMQSADGAQQAYYFVSGFRNNGEPWPDPEKGETKFPLAGDPVTDTGWLSHDIDPHDDGTDIRMGVSSGPFDLGVGESQDILLAVFVGQGTDRLNSIEVMRQYDASVQEFYDNNYQNDSNAGSNDNTNPEQFGLRQNYPNPFNPSTTIPFHIPAAGHVTVRIYSVLGKEITTIADTDYPAGLHGTVWNGTDHDGRPMPGGIYLIRMEADDFAGMQKCLLVK